MVKVNCRNKHSDQCPVCIIELDNQQQVFKCTKLLQECDMIVDDEILHSHIFDKNVKKQALAVKLFKFLWDLRTSIFATVKYLNFTKNSLDIDYRLVWFAWAGMV